LYVAWITTIPGATAVTRPLADTVAMAEFDDVHVDVLVTSCVELLDSVAVAVNCDVVPTVGEFPVTAIDDTVLGVVDDPQAATVAAISKEVSNPSSVRSVRFVRCGMGKPQPICAGGWPYFNRPRRCDRGVDEV
jgi:hypothetical protein